MDYIKRICKGAYKDVGGRQCREQIVEGVSSENGSGLGK